MVNFLKKQKPLNIILLLIIIIGLIVYVSARKSKQEDFEVIGVLKKNIIQEVSLTGRVRPAQNVDLVFERAGIVSDIFVEVGERVDVNQALAKLKSQDAERELQDAQLSLEKARLSLGKTNLQQFQQERGDDLNKKYETGMSTLASMYDEVISILDDIDDIFFENDFSVKKDNIDYYSDQMVGFENIAGHMRSLIDQAKELHKKSIVDYQVAQIGNDSNKKIAVQSGYDLTIKVSEIIKIGRDLIRDFQDFVIGKDGVHDYQDIISDHSLKLTNYAQDMDSYSQNLSTVINAINSQQDSLDNYSIDLQSQELAVGQAENAVLIAQNNLNKYFIRSPIKAIVTKKNLKIGEAAQANMPVISVISESQFEIETFVPEADIAKIQIGNLAKITLDAFGRDVEFSASVVSIDLSETMVEGVATYKTILQFSEKDERVKSGMTANINILSGEKTGVLAVPQRALIRNNNDFFVRVVREDGRVEEIIVETGLRGSDGLIEIISGLKEGDKIINL